MEALLYRPNSTYGRRNCKRQQWQPIKDGDSVILIKSLPVKGTLITLKKGLKIKNIRLTDDDQEVDCRA